MNSINIRRDGFLSKVHIWLKFPSPQKCLLNKRTAKKKIDSMEKKLFIRLAKCTETHNPRQHKSYEHTYTCSLPHTRRITLSFIFDKRTWHLCRWACCFLFSLQMFTFCRLLHFHRCDCERSGNYIILHLQNVCSMLLNIRPVFHLKWIAEWRIYSRKYVTLACHRAIKLFRNIFFSRFRHFSSGMPPIGVRWCAGHCSFFKGSSAFCRRRVQCMHDVPDCMSRARGRPNEFMCLYVSVCVCLCAAITYELHLLSAFGTDWHTILNGLDYNIIVGQVGIGSALSSCAFVCVVCAVCCYITIFLMGA